MATPQNFQNQEPKRLYRSKIDRIIAGVCGGFAEYFNIDPVIIRLLFLVLIFVNGWGLLLYLVSLIVMRENPLQSAADRKPAQNTSLYWGAGLIILGLVLLAHQWEWRFSPFIPFDWHWFRFWFFDWDIIWPLIIILLGVLYLIHVLQKPEEQGEAQTTGTTTTRLYRSREEKIIAGVCGGLAQKVNVDPVLIRIGYVIFTLATNLLVGAIIYIVWIIAIPEEPTEIKKEETPAPKKRTRVKRVKKVPEKSGDGQDSSAKSDDSGEKS